MAAVTLTTLRARVREHSDTVNSQFVTDTANSVDSFINTGLDELYDIVMEHFGEDYFVQSASFVTVAGDSQVTLPSDFYKLLGVDLTIGTDRVDLVKFEFKERNFFRAAGNIYGANLPRYRLEGSSIRLYPAPAAAYDGLIWYVPTRTLLVSGSDTCNFPNGWEEAAVLSAAIKIIVKEESDPSALMQLKAEVHQRIEQAAANRDAGQPSTVTDITRAFVGIDPSGGL